jgi:F0F1-type ATP synthase membrane subunit b/b'
MHIDSNTAKTLETLAYQAFNLLVFGFLVYRGAKAPFLQFVANRSTSLRAQILDAKKQLEAAQAQYAEFRSRLQSMDAEVAALRAQNNQDVAAVSARIREEAAKQAQRIVSDARIARDAAIDFVRTKMTQELGLQVLNRAEALIQEKLTGDQKARIRREFSTQLEQIQ